MIKLLTKQLENHNTIHQQCETTVAGMNLSNLPAKFLQVDELLDFEKVLISDEDLSKKLVSYLFSWALINGLSNGLSIVSHIQVLDFRVFLKV